MKPHVFYSLATEKKWNSYSPKLLCGCSTFSRRFLKFKQNNLIPESSDYGIQVGAPPIIQDNNLKLLDDNLKTTIGIAEGNHVLAENMTIVKEDYLSSRGHHIPVKLPHRQTAKFYQFLSTVNNPDIHLVKESSSKCKDRRR